MRGVAFPDKGDKCNQNLPTCTYHKVFIQRVQNTVQAQQYKENGVHYKSKVPSCWQMEPLLYCLDQPTHHAWRWCFCPDKPTHPTVRSTVANIQSKIPSCLEMELLTSQSIVLSNQPSCWKMEPTHLAEAFSVANVQSNTSILLGG